MKHVHEAYGWDADINDESGVLIAHQPSSEIETVACQKCAEEYDPSQFTKIEFADRQSEIPAASSAGRWILGDLEEKVFGVRR
jgi:hypothetical protein